MYDVLMFAGVVAGWIVLNLWVLPFFGIRTCMSGACRAPEVRQVSPQNSTSTVDNVSPSPPKGVRT